MIQFKQTSLAVSLQNRRLLCNTIDQFHTSAISSVNCRSKSDWAVNLGESLLFDSAGLQLIANTIKNFKGNASRLSFQLILEEAVARDYYSHQPTLKQNRLELPITAERRTDAHATHDSNEVITIHFNYLETHVAFPASLIPRDINQTPLALLMPYSCEHDLLFANQIAIFANIARDLKQSPSVWLKGLISRLSGTLKQRISLCYTRIHPSSQIHPSAIIEGSVIGPGCQIGAHCVVRYSVLGKNVKLHDGAKTEYSVIDDQSWLMHDLVLYRSLVEKEVFLIHGPYQFSYFQHQSSAFATIMMDYRPDGQEIKIMTPSGIQNYRGRFLGALLQENSRVLGGSMTAPGVTIPKGSQIVPENASVVRGKDFTDQLTQLHQVQRPS